jgi:hypothetical protein
VGEGGVGVLSNVALAHAVVGGLAILSIFWVWASGCCRLFLTETLEHFVTANLTSALWLW